MKKSLYTIYFYIFCSLVFCNSSYAGFIEKPLEEFSNSGCPVEQKDPKAVLYFVLNSRSEMSDLSFDSGRCTVAIEEGRYTQQVDRITNMVGFPYIEGFAYVGDSFEIEEITKDTKKAVYKVHYMPFAVSSQLKNPQVLKYSKYKGPKISITYHLVSLENKWFVLEPKNVYLFKKEAALNEINDKLSVVTDKNILKILKANKELLEKR